VTLLGFGLARFRVTHQQWEFVAIPGAVLYFVNDELFISTRHYLRGQDYEQITQGLRQELLAEEEALREIKQSIRRLEEEMFRRLWKVGRSGEPLA
jgi:F-type H+-transporting ATPase subunit epsilon